MKTLQKAPIEANFHISGPQKPPYSPVNMMLTGKRARRAAVLGNVYRQGNWERPPSYRRIQGRLLIQSHLEAQLALPEHKVLAMTLNLHPKLSNTTFSSGTSHYIKDEFRRVLRKVLGSKEKLRYFMVREHVGEFRVHYHGAIVLPDINIDAASDAVSFPVKWTVQK